MHLLPFFVDRVVAEITPSLVQEYRVHRASSRKHPKTGEAQRPARSTLHHEIVTLRQVLKTAQRYGWLQFVPDLSPPYKTSPKIRHRAWFSPEEYKQLYEASRHRARNPLNPRWKWACEQPHDYVLLMVNTGLRPDEAARLDFRDVEVVEDAATAETILEISVRGKRGVGYCKSMPGAVYPFQRLRERLRPCLATGPMASDRAQASPGHGRPAKPAKSEAKPLPTDRLFPTSQRELLNTILDEQGLKRDREGQLRTAYSLRHTYICLRLMEGADIYQIAKNCRTSVEMIEKFYATHIKNMIDAAAVNVRRAPPTAAKERTGESDKGSDRRPPAARGDGRRQRIGQSHTRE